jgi:hypothetical protein
VKLVSVDEPMLDDSPVGKLTATMLTALSQFYSDSLSSRVRYRFQVHREQGRYLHAAPLGYRNVKQNGQKTLAFDDSAPPLKQAFEMMATGGYSSDAVRQFVTAGGLRTKKGHKLVLPVLAKANAHKRIEDAEQRQRHLATQLSDKKALRKSLIESKLRGELKQEEFREMADMIAHDIEGIEAAQRAFVAEAEAALQLTTDTSRTTIPAKALWASAHLTDKLTVQNALFPEGILYRTDIRFFEPPDNDLQAMVFRILLANRGEPDWEEIESGRGERI